MSSQRPDKLAIFVFIGLLTLLMGSAFLLIKSFSINKISQIKFTLPPKPMSTVTIIKNNRPTDKPSPATSTPTAIPTRHNSRTPTAKAARTCHRLSITLAEFASNKCYTQADYSTLVSVLSKYNTASSRLEFANASVDITCNCQNKRACDFFKESCAKDKDA